MSINLKDIIFETINENKEIYASGSSLLIGLIIYNIVFPKLYSRFVSNIPDTINGLDYHSVIVVLAPFLIYEFLFYISDLINSNTVPNIELSVVHKLTNKVLESVKTTKNKVNPNELMLNIKKIFDIKNIYHLISSYVAPSLILSLGIVLYFTYADTKAGIITFIILLLAFTSLIYMSNTCFKKTNKHEKHINKFCDDIHDIFSNIESVMASGTDKIELERINSKNSELYNKCVDKEYCSINLKFLFAMIYFSIMVILNGLSLKLFYDGKIEKDTLIAIFFMVLTLVQLYDCMIYELGDIVSNIGKFQETERYFDEFKINSTKSNDTITISNGDIFFDKISLKYDNKTIFDNFELYINGNSKVALVGEIGSGKTSLFRILTGIVEYDGNVYLDNTNIKNYDNNLIMKHIAYIPQNPKLFNRSIYENITYGLDNPKNHEQKINDMLKYFELHEIFNSFRDGLNTNVGKHGEKLSGGQRQLVYILRSLMHNKKILLLDEPTSALDNEHKYLLINLLNKIKNKTIIVITHDKDMLSIFDKIITLKNGKVV